MMKVVNDCMIHEKMVNIKQEVVKEGNLKVTRLCRKEKNCRVMNLRKTEN